MNKFLTITIEGVAKLLALTLEAIKFIISIKERSNKDDRHSGDEEQ